MIAKLVDEGMSRRGAIIGISIALAVYVFCWVISTVRLVHDGGGVIGIIVNTLFWTPLLFLFGGVLVHGIREKE